MKITSIKLGRLGITFAFILSVLVAQFAHVQFANAATLTWDGSAGDGKFSTAANWSSNSVPVTGDIITFTPLPGGTNWEEIDLTNDLSGVAFGGLIQTSSTSDLSKMFHVNTITFEPGASFTTSPTGSNTKYANVDFGATGSYGTGIVNAQGDLTSNTYIGAVMHITGNLNSTGFIGIKAGSTFGGNVTVLGGSIASGIVIPGTLTLPNDNSGLTIESDTATINTNMTIGSLTGVTALNQLGFGNCTTPLSSGGAGGGAYVVKVTCGTYATATITLAGTITLNADLIIHVAQGTTVDITGTVVSNGHTITLEPSSAGTLTVGSTGIVAQDKTTTLDGDQASTDLTITNRETASLNGTRRNISVLTGGILKGTGVANSISISTGAILSPGNSPGKVTASLFYSQNGEYRAEVLNKDTYDQLAVGAGYVGSTGSAVNLGSGASLNLVLYDGWSIAQGDQFRIIDNLSATAIAGIFTGLAEGAQFTSTDGGVSVTFSISYIGGDGNDVVITALNAGTDPTPPNTGAEPLKLANPVLMIGLGIGAAVILFALARRRLNR